MVLSESVVEKLQALATNSINARHFFQFLKNARKNRTVIDLYRLKLSMVKGGIQVNDLDLASIGEALQKLGLGKLTVRSTPLHSTFKLSKGVLAVELGTRALQGLQKRSEATPQYLTPNPLHKSAPRASGNVLKVFYHFNDDLGVALDLPGNFDSEMARRLGQYLLSIARQHEAN